MIDGFLIAKLISLWLFGFSTMLSIINPFGIAFVSERNRVPNPAAGRMSCISANGVRLACSPFAKQGMVLTLHRQEKVSGSKFLLPDE